MVLSISIIINAMSYELLALPRCFMLSHSAPFFYSNGVIHIEKTQKTEIEPEYIQIFIHKVSLKKNANVKLIHMFFT